MEKLNGDGMMAHKHRRTKAVEITKDVKIMVALRDNGMCVLCGSSYGKPNAHFIPRSKGGLGIEQNIVTLCPECHHKFDNTIERKDIAVKLRKHLQSKYEGWDEKALYYNKYSQYSG